MKTVTDIAQLEQVGGGVVMAPGSGSSGGFWGDIWDSFGGGDGGNGGYDVWESGWGEWDSPVAPSEGHLAFDTAMTGAVGARTAIAVTGFTEALLIGIGGTAALVASPVAITAGLVAGGFAYFGAKKALEH